MTTAKLYPFRGGTPMIGRACYQKGITPTVASEMQSRTRTRFVMYGWLSHIF